MKVLMLGWELPPHNSGGLGVACYQLCKALSSRGVDIEFILPYTTQEKIDFMEITAARPVDVAEILAAGIAYDSQKYLHLDGSEQWLDIFGQAKLYEKAIERIVHETEFDVIHAHDWLTFRAALKAKERTNKPLLLHVHSIESDRAGGEHGNPFVREIEYTAFSLADKIIAVSERTRQSIIDQYEIPGDKIAVVHNSIEVSDVIPLDGDNAYRYLETMKQQGYRVVTNVGRLTLQKGLPNLLRAAQLVIAHEPKTFFMLVGNGEQYNELIEQAAELGIAGNVLFTGFQRGKRWRDAFAIADIFVMPSISEPFGLTPLEAIGYGTPSLISKQSGVSEVLNNCLKVDFWDIDEMAHQITSALRDQSLREEMLHNATREYERMSWSHAADKMLDVYRQHVGVASL